MQWPAALTEIDAKSGLINFKYVHSWTQNVGCIRNRGEGSKEMLCVSTSRSCVSGERLLFLITHRGTTKKKGPHFALGIFKAFVFNNNSETVSNSWAQLCSSVKLKVYYTWKHLKKTLDVNMCCFCISEVLQTWASALCTSTRGFSLHIYFKWSICLHFVECRLASNCNFEKYMFARMSRTMSSS